MFVANMYLEITDEENISFSSEDSASNQAGGGGV